MAMCLQARSQAETPGKEGSQEARFWKPVISSSPIHTVSGSLHFRSHTTLTGPIGSRASRNTAVAPFGDRQSSRNGVAWTGPTPSTKQINRRNARTPDCNHENFTAHLEKRLALPLRNNLCPDVSLPRLSEFFERVFIINLPGKADRRDRLERHLYELGLARPGDLAWVRAVSGDLCWPPPYFKAGGGAWGCLQSHLRVAQDAAMDGLESYLVLEDDAVFDRRSSGFLRQFMNELPEDWGQIYLGGQHLHEPGTVPGTSLVYRCHNVCRTHAYAVHKRALGRFQQHIGEAADYMARGQWHLDHQLGLAHERDVWPTYAPAWWLAGQEEGSSNISGRRNPRLWWHLTRFSGGLPFIHVGPDWRSDELAGTRGSVHFGNNLKAGTLEDIGLDACVHDDHALKRWLAMIARESMDMGLLPGIQHPSIPIERVRECWSAGAQPATSAETEALLDYPYNGLFPHPLNVVPPVLFCVSAAA